MVNEMVLDFWIILNILFGSRFYSKIYYYFFDIYTKNYFFKIVDTIDLF